MNIEPLSKPHTFNFVLIFVICIFAILGSIYLFFGNKPNNDRTIVNDAIDTNKLTENGFPKDYEECFDKTKDSFDNFDEISKVYRAVNLNFQCTIEVEDVKVSKKAYEFCIQNGGKITEGYKFRCIDYCPDAPAKCSFTYYNPTVIFPNSHEECRNFSNIFGHPYLRDGLDFCEAEVSLLGAADSIIAKKMIDNCSQISTKMNFIEKDNNHCKLTFFAYVCPENNVSYCIDPNDEHNKLVCSDEAQQWYKTNCPNYKGIASWQIQPDNLPLKK
jgi:hypothetical protein